MSLASKSLWDLETLSPLIVTIVTIGFHRAENRCPINHIYVVQAPRDPRCALGTGTHELFPFPFSLPHPFPLASCFSTLPQKMVVCSWLVGSLFLFALRLQTTLGEGGKHTIKQSIYYAGPFLSWVGFLGVRRNITSDGSHILLSLWFCKIREGGSEQTRANTSTRHSQLLFLWRWCMDRMMVEGRDYRFKPEIRRLWQSEPLSLSECYEMVLMVRACTRRSSY